MGEKVKLDDIFGRAMDLLDDIHYGIDKFESLGKGKGKGKGKVVNKIECETLSALATISSRISRIFFLSNSMDTTMAKANLTPYYLKEYQGGRRIIIDGALSAKSRLQELIRRLEDQGLLQEEDYIRECEKTSIQDIEEAIPPKTWLQKLDDFVSEIGIMMFLFAGTIVPIAYIIDKYSSL